jgi:hypothetical protein
MVTTQSYRLDRNRQESIHTFLIVAVIVPNGVFCQPIRCHSTNCKGPLHRKTCASKMVRYSLGILHLHYVPHVAIFLLIFNSLTLFFSTRSTSEHSRRLSISRLIVTSSQKIASLYCTVLSPSPGALFTKVNNFYHITTFTPSIWRDSHTRRPEISHILILQ